MSEKETGLADVHAGAVTFRWDLDKTYLRTEFESLGTLVRIPFEAGADKVHLPGVPTLIRSLRRHATERERPAFVFFLSASPPQIGAAIREKLEIDDVEYDGITFKDQLGHLVRGRWGSLREQVGYKLGALLSARVAGPASQHEFLFGDDWESDPLIYSLYADVLRGALDVDRLGEILRRVDVAEASVERIRSSAEALLGSGPDTVARIYINLERKTPPSRFRPFGPRLVPTFNTLQAAASLFEEDQLGSAAVLEVAHALHDEAGMAGHRLRNSIDDLTRRGHLRLRTRDRLVRTLARDGLAPLAKQEEALRARLRAAVERLRRRSRSTGLPGADYEAILGREAGR